MILKSKTQLKDGVVKTNITQILIEIQYALRNIDEKQIDDFVNEIIKSNKIIVHALGRTGMAIKGFCMRLGHLGLSAYMLGDTTCPSAQEGDLFIISSGSGETQSTYDLVLAAKKHNAKVALITSNADSRIGKLADVIVEIQAPSKIPGSKQQLSIQPMSTLFEQSTSVLFDAIVLLLMKKLGVSAEAMKARHINIE